MRHWHLRLWEKVHIQDNGCWEWMGARKDTGHGQLNINHRAYTVHRLVWEQCFGSIPKRLFVCHKCNNAACVNPAHLRLGTHLENVMDRTLAGRWRTTPMPYKAPTITAADRFWLKVNKTENCWLWKAGVIGDYGTFMFRGKPHRAHRVSWILAHGDIPEGLDVLHKCDTPKCVNPDHLFLGTQTDNTRDCESKGRAIHPKGSDHGCSKLTDDEILEIRRIYNEQNMNGGHLGRRFGVTRQLITKIVRREIWKHLS